MPINYEEVPFTTEAIKIFIATAEKRMEEIHPFVLENDKLKRRIKAAKEKLDQRRSG